MSLFLFSCYSVRMTSELGNAQMGSNVSNTPENGQLVVEVKETIKKSPFEAFSYTIKQDDNTCPSGRVKTVIVKQSLVGVLINILTLGTTVKLRAKYVCLEPDSNSN